MVKPQYQLTGGPTQRQVVVLTTPCCRQKLFLVKQIHSFQPYFSWKNEDETFGALISLVRQEHNLRRDAIEAWSWTDVTLPWLICGNFFYSYNLKLMSNK